MLQQSAGFISGIGNLVQLGAIGMKLMETREKICFPLPVKGAGRPLLIDGSIDRVGLLGEM